jgi:hypothetical protein
MYIAADNMENVIERVLKLRYTDPFDCHIPHVEAGSVRSSVLLVNKSSFLLRTTPRLYREHPLVSTVRCRKGSLERREGHLWGDTYMQ